MMERSKQRLKVLKIITMLITLFIFVFCSSFSAYALNENYMIDEYHNWLDVENRYDYNQKNDGFDGFLKSVSDEEDGSFYIFFKFFDKRIASGNDENIVLTFTVENDENKYRFAVNKDGFINTGQNDMNAVKLVSNFDNFSCSSMGGEIFVGFELRNNDDRALTNYISCDYAAGVDTTTVLFENEILDLFVEPTEKATAAKGNIGKTTAAKEKTTQKKSSASAKSSTAKSDKSKNTGITKFKGSGIYSGDSNEYLDDNTAETEDAQTTVPSTNPIAQMSVTAIIILVISILAILAGIIVLTVALASKKQNNEENIEESSL